jgi:hypothetical protein
MDAGLCDSFWQDWPGDGDITLELASIFLRALQVEEALKPAPQPREVAWTRP